MRHTTTLVLKPGDVDQAAAFVHGPNPIVAVELADPGAQLTIQLSGPDAAHELADGLRHLADKIDIAYGAWAAEASNDA